MVCGKLIQQRLKYIEAIWTLKKSAQREIVLKGGGGGLLWVLLDLIVTGEYKVNIMSLNLDEAGSLTSIISIFEVFKWFKHSNILF